jgi:hypothetical protein
VQKSAINVDKNEHHFFLLRKCHLTLIFFSLFSIERLRGLASNSSRTIKKSKKTRSANDKKLKLINYKDIKHSVRIEKCDLNQSNKIIDNQF